MTAPKRFLVPVDFSPPSQAAAEYALELADALNARLTLLYVVEPPTLIAPEVMLMPPIEGVTYDEFAAQRARTDLQKFTEKLTHRAGVEVTVTSLVGRPRAAIIEHAAEGHYDLVVMGTHGRTGLSRLLVGSVADYVIRHAHCPVTTVRVGKKG